MNNICFKVFRCGESDKTYSSTIMISKPHTKIEMNFGFEQFGNEGRVSDLLEKVHQELIEVDAFAAENLDISRVYVEKENRFFRLQYDKMLLDIRRDFGSDDLTFVTFLVGGASWNIRGYQFIVHSNEEIHKNQPHIHVRKDDLEVRYSLDTLEYIQEGKKLPREYKRDEKKIILPFLRSHLEELLDNWNRAINGYVPPSLDQDDRQWYDES